MKKKDFGWCRAILPYSLSLLILFASQAGAAADVEVNPFNSYQLFKLIGSLVLVVVVIVVVAIYLRRLQQFNLGEGRSIKVLQSVAVGPRERVVLLAVGDEQILLGVGGASVNLVKVLDKPLDTRVSIGLRGRTGAGGRFAADFQKAVNLQRAEGESAEKQ